MLKTKDLIMLLVVVITLAIEFILIYYFRGKNNVYDRIRYYLARGGITYAKKIKVENIKGKKLLTYQFFVKELPFTTSFYARKEREKIAVYYNPLNPDDNLTLVGLPLWKRILPRLLPAIAITIIALAYLILYH